MFYLKSSLKNKPTSKNKILRTFFSGLCGFALPLFLMCQGFEMSAQALTINPYTINLPQTTGGVEQIEYTVYTPVPTRPESGSYYKETKNGKDDIYYTVAEMGETAGHADYILFSDQRISFSVKFANSSDYSQLTSQNIKFTSDKGTSLDLYTMDEPINGLITYSATPAEGMDYAQTYITKPYGSTSSEKFEISGINVDTYETSFALNDSAVNISDALTIHYSGVLGGKKIEGTLPTPDSTSCVLDKLDVNSALSFSINLKEGYSQSNIALQLAPESTPLNLTDGTYSFDIISNSEITISGAEINTYDLTFDDSSGHQFSYRLQGNTEWISVPSTVEVNYSQSYDFKCNPAINPDNEEMTVNGIAIQQNNDEYYTLPNIIQNNTISVKPKTDSKYLLAFSGVTQVSILSENDEPLTSPQSIAYGSEFKFKTAPSIGYTQHFDDITIKYQTADGLETEVEKDLSGMYSIPNITEPMSLIANATPDTYNVTLRFEDMDGKTQIPLEFSEPTFDINYGAQKTVSVTLDNMGLYNVSYEDFDFTDLSYDISPVSDNIHVSWSPWGSPQGNDGDSIIVTPNPSGCYFTIKGISADTTIIVKDVKYKVKFESSNLTFYESDGETSITEKFLKSSESYKFSLKLNEGYTLHNTTLTLKGYNFPNTMGSSCAPVTLTPDKNGFYTINGPVGITNSYITSFAPAPAPCTVAPLKTPVLRQYTVRFSPGSAYSSLQFYNKNEDIEPYPEITSDVTVEHGGSFKFSAYNADSPVPALKIISTLTDDSANLLSGPDSNGTYTITNITDDISVIPAGFTMKSNFQTIPEVSELQISPVASTNPGTYFTDADKPTAFKITLPTDGAYSLSDVVLKIYKSNSAVEGNEISNGISISGPDGAGVFKVNCTGPQVYSEIYIFASLPQTYNIHMNYSNNPGVRFSSVHHMEIAGQNLVYTKSELDQLQYVQPVNKEFKFVIHEKEGYEFGEGGPSLTVYPESQATVKKLAPVMPASNQHTYVISGLKSDIQIIVGNVNQKKYQVNFYGEGTTFYNENITQFSKQFLPHGSAFTFQTSSGEGYLSQDTELSAEADGITYPSATTDWVDNVLTIPGVAVLTKHVDADGEITCIISNITAPFDIIIGKKPQQFDITFTNTPGIKYKEWINDSAQTNTAITSAKCVYNGDYTFAIEAEPGIDIGEIVVKANDKVLDLINDHYTIENITQSITVSVSGIKNYKYKVIFTQIAEVAFTDESGTPLSTETEVRHGDNLKFKIKLSSMYENSDYAVTATAETLSPSAITLSPENGIYTLGPITSPQRVTIENLKIKEHTVKLTQTTGINYYNMYGNAAIDNPEQVKVSYGNPFSFKVVASEGYNISNLKVYSYKNEQGGNATQSQLLPVNGVYTIENITADYTISVDNIDKLIYNVELRTLDGAAYVDTYGNLLPSSVQVEHGGTLEFKISLDNAYNKSNPTVNIKGSNNNLSPNGDGVYSISEIKENRIIEILNIQKNTYTATFKDAEGVIYKTNKNKPFSGTQKVDYGGSLYFIVSLMDAYDQSAPWVLLDDEKTLIENGGVYNLENIRKDIEVSVKNVSKNPEEVTMDDVKKIPENIISGDDIDAVVRATNAYNSLSEDDKKLVTNLSQLQEAQQEVGKLNHSVGNITVTGMDWNIKLIVNNLTENEEQMNAFSEKVDRKSVLSLYEIHLLNIVSNEEYEVPYGQKVTVTIPIPDLTGYKNAVVAHQKTEGSMEYLDMSINSGFATFETSSFSLFGVAAKKIPNYVENPSEIAISVSELIEDEEELQNLLGEGLVSQLGDFTNLDDKNTDNSNNKTNSQEDSNAVSSAVTSFGAAATNSWNSGIEAVDKAYDWAVKNEFAAVLWILIIGALLIALILWLNNRRKNQDDQDNQG